MALIACDECGLQISDKAASCPHCGAPIAPPTSVASPAPEVPRAPSTPPLLPQPASNRWRSWVMPALVLLLFGTCFKFCSNANDEYRQQEVIEQRRASDPEGSVEGAFDVCQTFVKRQLKAPSTAAFPSTREADPFAHTTYQGEGTGTYVVRSWVDSQNGFGAQVRSEYVCKVKKAAGTNWTLIDLAVNTR